MLFDSDSGADWLFLTPLMVIDSDWSWSMLFWFWLKLIDWYLNADAA